MNLLKTSALVLCVGLAGCSQWQTGKTHAPDQSAASEQAASQKHSWWPLGSKKETTKSAAEASQAGMAWLDQHEKPLRAAVSGSDFSIERRDNALVMIVPVDSSFNPKRPELLLPITLGPLGRVAKLVLEDPQGGVMIVGHSDSSGNKETNQKLSVERAQAVASIFRLSGLERNRLRLKGVGADLPRADNGTTKGRALNRRVEVLWAPRDVLPTLAHND